MQTVKLSFTKKSPTNEVIPESVSQHSAALRDGDCSSSSDSEDDTDTGPAAPMMTQSVLSNMEWLIDFVHVRGLLQVSAQQLDTMHTTVVKTQLPCKQVLITKYFSAPNV